MCTNLYTFKRFPKIMCTKSRAKELINHLGQELQNKIAYRCLDSGGPASVYSVSNSMSLVSINRAAGAAAASTEENEEEPPHPLTLLKIEAFGVKSNGDEGILRYHEFKNKLTPVFKFNQALGSIFSAKINSTELGEFIDELYLSDSVVSSRLQGEPFSTQCQKPQGTY
jgi:hypothetical protein